MKTKKIILRTARVAYFINPEEVLYMIANGSYTTIHLISGEKIRLTKNSKQVLSLFIGYDFFIRINRTFIINVHYADKVVSENNENNIEIRGGHLIPISAATKKEFLENFK